MSEMTLPEIIVTAALRRIKHGEQFSDDELDLLLALSSKYTDLIVEQLPNAEAIIKFAGLLRDRQETLAARHVEAMRQARAHMADYQMAESDETNQETQPPSAYRGT
jgi:hypothetical protein